MSCLQVSGQCDTTSAIKLPTGSQVAALCYREIDDERLVLLITSRDTGRWIVPKGGKIPGLKDHKAAAQEAWEEAGVKAEKIKSQPIGSYHYIKRLKGGNAIYMDTQVYKVRVADLADNFPEADERNRKWVTPAQAAEMVDEPELKELLRSF